VITPESDDPDTDQFYPRAAKSNRSQATWFTRAIFAIGNCFPLAMRVRAAEADSPAESGGWSHPRVGR